ncbi:MAG: hypothetical protein DWP97_03020 [Calditrichaeota bacterium]|nr:MAG: hypothetical protein DWP97_03020 [Calditrichota bacterium]
MYKKLLFLFILLFASSLYANGFVKPSEVNQNQVNIRYSVLGLKTQQTNSDNLTLAQIAEPDEIRLQEKAGSGKSPGKAFFLSLAVPGLGQLYNGSKVKAAVFLGAEVASWVFHIKLHGDGDNLTDDYEAFNDAHWSEDRYTYMLENTYGASDDDDVDPLSYPEINHHLPETKTQQYYEMTGKYDQFSWGWDDAVLNGNTFAYYDTNSTPLPQVVGADIPYSANRFTYEQMRNDANDKYDQARNMVYISMANHVISAFEAMIAAKKYRNGDSDNSLLSRINLKASLRSYNEKRDTPYLTCKVKF